MSRNKKVVMMLAKGGAGQSGIAAALHVSKRDVPSGAKAMREHGLTFDAVSSMDAGAIDGLLFPKGEHGPNEACLRPDTEALAERKKRNRKLPVKLFWTECREQAESERKLACACQTSCGTLADAAERMDAAGRFVHGAGAECCIDRAGDAAFLTDKLLGTKAEARVPVVALPFSGRLRAGGFCDMGRKPWQEGRMREFEGFGGVPRMRAQTTPPRGSGSRAMRALPNQPSTR